MWFKLQWEWVKSFLSDPLLTKNEIPKGSMKRLSALILILGFAYEYHRMVNSFLEKLNSLSSVEFMTLTKIKLITIPDVPEYWMILLGAILGLNIIDYVYKKKKLKEDEIDEELNEYKNKTSKATQNLHKRLLTLEEEENK